MKRTLGVTAAFLVAPLALVAQTPAPTKPPGAAGGPFEPGKSYVGVRQQQGKVQTDADWNEQVQTCRKENERLKAQLETLRAENLSLKRRLSVPPGVHTPAPK